MRIAFTTLGCKINQYETEQMRLEVAASGNTVVSFHEEADVYIINTCTVTAKSDYQCRQAIRAAVRRGEGAKIVVTGCYAETRPDEIRKIPGVDIVIGNQEKGTIPGTLIAESTSASTPAMSVPEYSSSPARTRGFLKIQDGCNKGCSYCIVPVARGRSRSIAPGVVIGEFEEMVGKGCPEIVLSGIHIGAYGADLAPAVNLTRLITALLDKRGRARVRLSSIEPREITGDLIGMLGKGLCRHLHIPLQSGDDAVLAAMKRDYTAGFYQDLVEGIAARVPGIALGADVMVGFPGEGEKQFENTVRLIQNSPLTHLHVFSYSRRPGTEAAVMDDQVPEQIKKERSERLRELGREKNAAFRKRFAGSALNVVIESKTDPATGALSGLTDNYIRVLIPELKQEAVGKEVTVKITESETPLTIGTIC